ncbi:hypothetical protein C5Y96_10805 [Blastopirellula marina]|uniref:Uncharacterized protein n=1 Tax=Blastopirellula marina TaxID=124 RepID=A0A2S8FMA6_9BACT|nr:MULTISPECIES: hypothetical protein [Pirellulaceae]PQO33333.1 hypothetical protein C5Y96_10805 [Blastopirellula marina]RCS52422.1 hypothetical protein DTL36_10815 [Bremerella cremea]
MAKYKVRLTDVATGEVRDMDVEAPTPEGAVAMYDASKFKATVIFAESKPQATSAISTAEGNRNAAIMLGTFVFLVVSVIVIGSVPPSSVPFVIGGGMVGLFGLAVLYLLWKISTK